MVSSSAADLAKSKEEDVLRLSDSASVSRPRKFSPFSVDSLLFKKESKISSGDLQTPIRSYVPVQARSEFQKMFRQRCLESTPDDLRDLEEHDDSIATSDEDGQIGKIKIKNNIYEVFFWESTLVV